MNAIYSLPFGRNQQFGKNMNKVLDAFVGGWQVSGIWSWHSGFPLTIFGSDASNTLARSARANCLVPGTVYGEQNSPLGGYQWFNPTAYGQPKSGTFGNCGVGTIRGPGLISLDANIAKTFHITERQHLEIRGEFLNVTNTPILNAPTRSLGTKLGLLQASQGARNVQLALKYLF